MLAELKVEFDGPALDYRQSSNLHGAIMETVSREYAEALHVSGLNPYSQCLVREGDQKVWYIRTINREAYEELLLPMASRKEIALKGGKLCLELRKHSVVFSSEEELMREFYEESCPRYLTAEFQTPTAFKRDGQYVNYPDLRLLFGSLMRKFSTASGKWNMEDEETLDQLTEYSSIIKYNLRTAPFPLEKVRIYGFLGNICIRVKGPETMARYVRMLLRFGRFSGIGIKTGIGMGAVRLAEWREKE